MNSFVLALILLTLPATGRAGASLSLPGGPLRAGDVVAIHWDGLPAGTREVELELSLDGGRWVRVSPELEAGEGAWRWRVPSIASAHARLRLRAGGEDSQGRSTEAIVGASSEFAIHTNRNTFSADGEWWQLGSRRAASCALAAPARAQICANTSSPAFVPESAPAAPPPRDHVLAFGHGQGDGASRPPAGAGRESLPQRYPLRN